MDGGKAKKVQLASVGHRVGQRETVAKYREVWVQPDRKVVRVWRWISIF